MSAKINLTHALATRLVLAKIGHPQRDEPLQVSKQVYSLSDSEQEFLTPIILKPFKNLTGHRFNHPNGLDQHELNRLSTQFFSETDLLDTCTQIASRLYQKSNHPNIKPGDLCILMIEGIKVNEESVNGLCLLKAESMTPYLSISERNGDLSLETEHGINPEKIDKGCLILNHLPQKGYYSMTFDRSGGETRFWVRDFLGLSPITDSPFLTKQISDMAVSFVKNELAPTPADSESDAETPPWERNQVTKEAIAYFEEKEKFSMQEFEERFIKNPEAVSKFREQKAKLEQETGQQLDDEFDISKKHLSQVKKQGDTFMKLDNGVEIRVKAPRNKKQSEASIEKGFDDEKGMKYIKVYFNRELS